MAVQGIFATVSLKHFEVPPVGLAVAALLFLFLIHFANLFVATFPVSYQVAVVVDILYPLFFFFKLKTLLSRNRENEFFATVPFPKATPIKHYSCKHSIFLLIWLAQSIDATTQLTSRDC
jgi:hypothetical protein